MLAEDRDEGSAREHGKGSRLHLVRKRQSQLNLVGYCIRIASSHERRSHCRWTHAGDCSSCAHRIHIGSSLSGGEVLLVG